MLLTGKIGLNQLSGPVGIVDVVDDTYKASKSYGGFAVSVPVSYTHLTLPTTPYV